jgi:PAS domain S-box-containing protein
MEREIREKIRAATEASGITKPDFIALLELIDQHYDKMEATLTQSLHTQVPLEAIFDGMTDALLSVDTDGVIRNCNKVCSRYFGRPREQLIGSPLREILPDLGESSIAEYLSPFMSSLDDTNFELTGGEVTARRADGSTFHARINASALDTIGGEILVALPRARRERTRGDHRL